MSMRIIVTKWRTSEQPFSLSAVHTPPLRSYRDNAKLACHGPALQNGVDLYSN